VRKVVDALLAHKGRRLPVGRSRSAWGKRLKVVGHDHHRVAAAAVSALPAGPETGLAVQRLSEINKRVLGFLGTG